MLTPKTGQNKSEPWFAHRLCRASAISHNRLLLSLLLFLLASCGSDHAASSQLPSWAKVTAEQIAEAKKHKLPVAFENELGMRFVLIPAGEFLMGSPESEQHRESSETKHEVTISEPFYLQITEVSNAQYRRMHATHSSGECQGHSLNEDSQPAGSISHEDALAFAAWLSEQAPSHFYQLPSEAQWEYTCRAGSAAAYPWGSSSKSIHLYANNLDSQAAEAMGEDASTSCPDDTHVVSAPVGSYLPNAWGLYDMLGNVYEWCADWHGDYAAHEPVDPTGPSSSIAKSNAILLKSTQEEEASFYEGPMRVHRGGCWRSKPQSCRSAARSWLPPTWRWNTRGFRLVARPVVVRSSE